MSADQNYKHFPPLTKRCDYTTGSDPFKTMNICTVRQRIIIFQEKCNNSPKRRGSEKKTPITNKSTYTLSIIYTLQNSNSLIMHMVPQSHTEKYRK